MPGRLLRSSGHITATARHRISLVSKKALLSCVRNVSTASKPIRILGLESSADDTCAAIVDSDKKIHANVVLKQQDLLGELA